MEEFEEIELAPVEFDDFGVGKDEAFIKSLCLWGPKVLVGIGKKRRCGTWNKAAKLTKRLRLWGSMVFASESESELTIGRGTARRSTNY